MKRHITLDDSAHAPTAVRLLIKGGIEVSHVAGDTIHLKGGTIEEAAPLLADLADLAEIENREIVVGEARATFIAEIEEMGRSLVSRYPMTEQQGWPIKIAEARAILSGDLDEEDATLLTVEAAITGETVADLATSTVAASALTSLIPAFTAGLRRRLEAALAAKPSEAELDAIRTSVTQTREIVMAAFATGDPAAVRAAIAQITPQTQTEKEA